MELKYTLLNVEGIRFREYSCEYYIKDESIYDEDGRYMVELKQWHIDSLNDGVYKIIYLIYELW